MAQQVTSASLAASGAFWAKTKPLYEPRTDLKVICIGAGAAGLLVAYKLQRHLDNFDLKVFEKNKGIAGTWYENRYPGCACDVPAHCYTYSFEPKTDWSSVYAKAGEIKTYFEDFEKKYKLGKYIQTEHQVTDAKWNASESQWEVEVLDLRNNTKRIEKAHFVINAGGFLNNWKYPNVDGLQDKYKGELYHSANWPVEDLDYKGKTLALIGNGSSGIQMLPPIAQKVDKLVVFMRDATWISPPFGLDQKEFTKEEISEFQNKPEVHLKSRKDLEDSMNSMFGIFHKGSDVQNALQAYMAERMKEALKDDEMVKKLTPKYSVGCRRLTPGANYLESLSRDNVEVVMGGVVSCTEKGPVDANGKEYPVDIIACATGFDTTWKPRFPVTGATGGTIQEYWKDEPKSYMGTAVPGFPNYYTILGPGAPVGNGPVLIAMEYQLNYILSLIGRWVTENISAFDVKEEPLEEFLKWKDIFMPNAVWAEDCRSWYKQGHKGARVPALWPGSTLHFQELLTSVHYEDYNIKYKEGVNRWSYLGNGLSTVEGRKGDLSYYIRNYDDTPINLLLKPSARKSEADDIAPVFDLAVSGSGEPVQQTPAAA